MNMTIINKDIRISDKGELCISVKSLLQNSIYTDVSYRKTKSMQRLAETVISNEKYVTVDSLSTVTRKKVEDVFHEAFEKYRKGFAVAIQNGDDATRVAVEGTARSLEMNEKFVSQSLLTLLKNKAVGYATQYEGMKMSFEGAMAYGRQCALVDHIYSFVCEYRATEPTKKGLQVKLRSLKANIATAISDYSNLFKVPTGRRFEAWFEEVVARKSVGESTLEIVKIKRSSNRNASKIDDDQLTIAISWHTNGTNMSVKDVYRRWVAYGKKNGWWINKNGEYAPPTEARLYQLLQPVKNPTLRAKTDSVSHYLKCIPATSRLLPTKANYVWVIDGTAHNENVCGTGNRVRQAVYSIKVMDAASMRFVGVSSHEGVKEPFDSVKAAIIDGIKNTGFMPAVIHCDHGPSFNELEKWCDSIGIEVYASMVGNARAKTIENAFSQCDNAITRYLKGYSGQNRTATGLVSSKPSERQETYGKRHSRSMNEAIEWLRTEGMAEWNEHIIETLERKPCGKTPYELYDELGSYTPKLDYLTMCRICGAKRERKLTIEGLEIIFNKERLVYYPPIETQEQRELASDIFTYTPLDKRNKNAMSIYILNPGEPAPVYTHDGQYLGLWELKKTVSYTAMLDKNKAEMEKLNNQTALQVRVKNEADMLNNSVRDFVERHPDGENIKKLGETPLVGRRREYVGRYDKTELLKQEIKEKASFRYDEIERDFEDESEYESIQIADPDTGEIIESKIKKITI